MPDREKVIYGLCKAIGALRALKNKFPSTEEDVEPGIQACIEAKELLKEQEAKHVEVCGQMFTVKYGHCPTCGKGMDSDTYPHWCGFCGQAVKRE